MGKGRVEEERLGAIAVWRFSNPPEGFMDEGTVEDLTRLLDRFDAEDGPRVAVLTGGDPGVFIRHYDVGALAALGRGLQARGQRFEVERPIPEAPYLRCLRRIETSPKPFVCAMNGTAMGGGFELALACDFRLVEAGPHALGLPEVNIGLLPGAGGTQRLPRLVGLAKAAELVMLGRTLSPREALRLGLVQDCVEGPVLPRALALAEELAEKPARALAHIKALIRAALEQPLAQGLAAERTLFCDLLVHEPSLARMERMNREGLDIRDGAALGRTKG